LLISQKNVLQVLAKQTQAHAERTRVAGIKVTEKIHEKNEMLPATFVGSLYKNHVVVFENCRCAWNRSRPIDVRTSKFVYFRIIFRFLLHITMAYPKWRHLVTKIPVNQQQAINHKLFETKCY